MSPNEQPCNLMALFHHMYVLQLDSEDTAAPRPLRESKDMEYKGREDVLPGAGSGSHEHFTHHLQ